jgi:GAF domain-containing protein
MRDARSCTALWELIDEAGGSPGVEELMDALEGRLRELIAFDALRVHVPAGGARASWTLLRCSPGYAPGASGSMLSIPLEDRKGLAGVLTLESGRAGGFDPADLGALLMIRADLAGALRHALLCERARADEPAWQATEAEREAWGRVA